MHEFLDLKNQYDSIKDEIDDEIYIINATANNKEKFLKNVFITKFDKNFDIVESISSRKADITSNEWIIENPIIFRDNQQIQLKENIRLISHFNFDKINKTFRDLNSLNLFELMNLKKENQKIKLK